MVYEDMLGQKPQEGRLAGMPEVRVLGVPRPYPPLTPEQIAKEMVPRIIEALTKPLNDKEKWSGSVTPDKPSRVAFTGTYDEVQAFFRGNDPAVCKWTDGLPIVPPTEERVAAFLAKTSAPRDKEFDVINREKDVGWKPKSLGYRFDVEKVAINGVMAGCTPDMMPILLAIAESFPGQITTTTPSAEIGVISGPIVDKLKMPAKMNVFSPGNLATSTLSRAMSLMRINLWHSKPNITMIQPLGNPLNNLIFAENADGSPWNTLGEEHGFSKTENTFTKFHTKGLWEFGMNLTGKMYDPAYSSKETKGGPLKFAMDLIKASSIPRYMVLILSPQTAQLLAAQGFKTKEDVRQFVFDNCTETLGERMGKDAWAESVMYVVPKYQLKLLNKTFATLSNHDILHYPTGGPSELHIVTAGSGYPGPALARGTHAITVSIDKWN